MGLNSQEKYIYDFESSWSDGSKTLLCLKTGDWRTQRPVIRKEICNSCGICMVFCPPQCITREDDAYTVNLEYCKGCGICAMECPKKAIVMTPEGEYADDCATQKY